jgi:GYF domain 2
MKKFYLHNGTEQEGPFDISELKSKGIKPETEIWHEGLTDWTKANQVEELKELFSKVTPPPIKPKKDSEQSKQKENKSSSGNKILRLALIVIGFFGIIAILNKVMTPDSNSSNYYEKKMSIEETENSDPLRFLSIDGKYNESFWGTKFKLNGKVTNRATIADYKDLVVRVTYYSKTKSKIGTNDYTIYQIFPPNQVTSFKLDVENYKDVKSIGIDIVKALAN